MVGLVNTMWGVVLPSLVNPFVLGRFIRIGLICNLLSSSGLDC